MLWNTPGLIGDDGADVDANAESITTTIGEDITTSTIISIKPRLNLEAINGLLSLLSNTT
jgi:hypothetical protein